MRRLDWRLYLGLLFAAGSAAQTAGPPRALSWQEIQETFKTNNPTLLAGKVTIDEARADETTAYLRPNPNVTLSWDQITPFSTNPYRPIWQSYVFGDLDYLHERRHKRELRLASARQATAIASSAQSDLERTLTFDLRDAFVRVLLAKAVVTVARENLAYYDKVLSVNKDRYQAGSIAQVDLQRLELQRLQFTSELETSQVDLRTAKIDLLTLMRDRTPVEEFDVTGSFDFEEPATTLAELRADALTSRPDLQEAQQSLEKSKTDHQLAVANGSVDPTFGVAASHQPSPLNTYLGFNISFPLRIFDRNQGEKARTLLDVNRNQSLKDATEFAALRDVDSAYATLQGTLELLRPYKAKYLKEADDVRSTVSFAYEHGAASLLDFLDAQKSYRDTQLSYLNLVGSYLSAANQLNFAVGHEVIR